MSCRKKVSIQDGKRILTVNMHFSFPDKSFSVGEKVHQSKREWDFDRD